MVVVLDPFLESRFRHLEGLREQLHALQGAIAAQQVRVIDQHNAVQLAVEQGVSSIRDDLRSLHGSINARRATLTRLRGHTSDIGGLAEAVSAAASGATETLRRDRWRESWLPSARLTPPGSPSPVVSAAASYTPLTATATAEERASQLAAARERMRRRGFAMGGGLSSGGGSDGGGGSSSGLGGADSLQQRLNELQASAIRSIQMAEYLTADSGLGPPGQLTHPPLPQGLDRASLRSLRASHEVVAEKTMPDDCCVCLEPRRRGQRLINLSCGHTLHAQCAQQWLARSACCPLCKQPVAPGTGHS